MNRCQAENILTNAIVGMYLIRSDETPDLKLSVRTGDKKNGRKCAHFNLTDCKHEWKVFQDASLASITNVIKYYKCRFQSAPQTQELYTGEMFSTNKEPFVKGYRKVLQRAEKDVATSIRSGCDQNGIEKNPRSTAVWFHKLGKIYKFRSPEKVCLIQSATLFNAALVRNPANKSDVQHDLQDLCDHILTLASAKEHVNLVTTSEVYSQQIEELRRNTIQDLETICQIPDTKEDVIARTELEMQKIEDMQKLQCYIAESYSGVMKSICERCIEILGSPPCKFALVGMGSLARTEITPYSDFENIIVLEEGVDKRKSYESVLEYFRWLAVVFQTILINFGETIIPSVGISSLNDFCTEDGDWFFDAYTKRGVSFDGLMPHACKSPLGRQNKTKAKPFKTELIKPISKMLMYLDSEEDLKNGYHLADVLTQTCYVAGDVDLYMEFEKSANRRNPDRDISNVKSALQKDLKKFSIFENLKDLQFSRKCNIKNMFFRTSTIFIAALGKQYKLATNSSHNIVTELAAMNVLDQTLCVFDSTNPQQIEHELKFAVAIACELRLRVYMEAEGQNDHIQIQKNLDSHLVSCLSKDVGKSSIEKYFVICWKLQQSLLQHNNLSVTDSETVNSDWLIRLLLRHSYLSSQGLDDFLSTISQNSKTEKIAFMHACTACLLMQEQPFRAHSVAVEALKLQEQLSHDKTNQEDLALCYNNVGDCYVALQKFQDAFKHFEKVLQIRQAMESCEVCDEKTTDILYKQTKCLMKLGKYEQAMTSASDAVDILHDISENSDADPKLDKFTKILKQCQELFKTVNYSADDATQGFNYETVF
uniref:uncharacterized protein LOC113474085 n=1 Tax=Ciona intestinalis TaxID=7719 RepID=UPI000EF49852|nr:uncharacterized protein LOC113474085 [Ciona intestinalis]|eukprot:XP_026689423.1 uncharacterized protein LOC113474085 [Ciona intestinalis]